MCGIRNIIWGGVVYFNLSSTLRLYRNAVWTCSVVHNGQQTVIVYDAFWIRVGRGPLVDRGGQTRHVTKPFRHRTCFSQQRKTPGRSDWGSKVKSKKAPSRDPGTPNSRFQPGTRRIFLLTLHYTHQRVKSFLALGGGRPRCGHWFEQDHEFKERLGLLIGVHDNESCAQTGNGPVGLRNT